MIKLPNIVLPSFSLNITDRCNFNCIYCPPHGENFVECENLCEIESILYLVQISAKRKLPVIRLTGGEPLLYPDRIKYILETCKNHFKGKLLINTNGSLLDKHIDMLAPFKHMLLLKISFDTLSSNCFYSITRPRNENISFETLLQNIRIAKNEGFKIEINTVVNKLNEQYIMDVINYADKNSFDIKLFGVNSFEGMIDYKSVHVTLNKTIEKIEKQYEQCKAERLPGNRGIEMIKYKMFSNCFIRIVDHSEKSDFNNQPKVFSPVCKQCKYYPCATGRFSITLRADGLLQDCRMNPERGENISGLSYESIEIIFESILQNYKDCKMI
jgi:cyclic pyranopterin phosphate synthase